MARVIIHYDEENELPPAIYVEGDVEVISVCDFAPNDRFYRMRGDPIPAEIQFDLDHAEIGYPDDGSEAERKTIDAFRKGLGNLN